MINRRKNKENWEYRLGQWRLNDMIATDRMRFDQGVRAKQLPLFAVEDLPDGKQSFTMRADHVMTAHDAAHFDAGFYLIARQVGRGWQYGWADWDDISEGDVIASIGETLAHCQRVAYNIWSRLK